MSIERCTATQNEHQQHAVILHKPQKVQIIAFRAIYLYTVIVSSLALVHQPEYFLQPAFNGFLATLYAYYIG